jgi:hypothetical protein
MGAVSALSLAWRGGLAIPSLAQAETTSPFRFLVVGDSLIWGQGLREDQKFYSLTRDWLQFTVFNNSREVDLKVKAHSGSTLTLHPSDAEGLKRAGRDESQYAHAEINIAFPSITKQIDLAAEEYAREAVPPESVGLIMLSGGITDIGAKKVLDTSADDEELRRDIVRYCCDGMIGFLNHAAAAFPLARIAVIGYFPMISPQTPTGRLANAYLETRRLPDPLKPFINNPLLRPIFNGDKKRGIERSRIWSEESNRNFQLAVNAFNDAGARAPAVFIKSPLTEEHALETPKTMLFRMRRGRTEDFLYAERKQVCKPELKALKAATGLKYSIRLCEIAAIGHPNVDGSRLYAGAIKTALRPLFRERSRAAHTAGAVAGSVLRLQY